MSSAGWSSNNTFAKFYNKTVQTENKFANGISQCMSDLSSIVQLLDNNFMSFHMYNTLITPGLLERFILVVFIYLHMCLSRKLNNL